MSAAPALLRRTLDAVWLGRRRYADVHALQERLLGARIEGRVGDLVLFLEHEPVVTLGRGADGGDLRMDASELAHRGIDVVATGRGGHGTYHGPGQLVGYPIVDLRPDRQDVRRYVRDLAEVMIRVARDVGVSAGAGETTERIGVWVDRDAPLAWPGDADAKSPAKLGAIGVRLSRWVTMHGFALNASTDLDEFVAAVFPCRIGDAGVTSLAALMGASPSVRALADLAAKHLADVLSATARPVIDLADAPLGDVVGYLAQPAVSPSLGGADAR